MNGYQLLTLAGIAALLTGCINKPDPYPPGTRIGTYDRRAVVIAYAGSKMFDAWLRDLQAQKKAAETAGDAKKVAEIEALAKRRQARFHRQTFGTEDILDVLNQIEPQVQALLAKENLNFLDRVEQPRPSHVETIDVTDRLVAVFEPDERTRGWIRDIRKKPLPKR